MGLHPEAETPSTPDEAVVVDAGDVVKAVGWVVCVGLRDFLDVVE
jgi:hypothetical protein